MIELRLTCFKCRGIIINNKSMNEYFFDFFSNTDQNITNSENEIIFLNQNKIKF
ncbi:hypothetical protein CLV48_102182 [Cecembia rubra]|uniref:Uncharacterized protein n=1 Tax=Cecembia rubra TaxID=1485585 RepID=A0A2P8EA67_9BACT|nr:hypothetical protein CLV48_102182 [Cecembia rubra]